MAEIASGTEVLGGSGAEQPREDGKFQPKAPSGANGKTAEDTARIIGTSPRTVERARAIIDHAPEHIREAVAGGMSINKAYVQTQEARKQEKRHGNPTLPGAGKNATEAMMFAAMAISQLERIRENDPLRS